MELLENLRKGFASLSGMGILPVENLTGTNKAWIIRIGKKYGVGVEVPIQIKIAEQSTGSEIWTSNIRIEGSSIHMLLLTSQNESLRMEFAVICAQFIDPGEGGRQRIHLVSNPLQWWETWKDLFGNKRIEKSVQGMLGELVSYKNLLMKNAVGLEWVGPKGAVVDFQSKKVDYEIKSTVSRYENIVKIAGQFQLERNTSKPLSLIFCRFEPSSRGITIDSVVNELVDIGVDRLFLEEQLEICGFVKESSSRKRHFNILEIREYKVNDDFPGITSSSFVGNKLPKAVKQITYSLDLTGIVFESW